MNNSIAKANFDESFNFDIKRELREHVSNGPLRSLTEVQLVIKADVLFKYLIFQSQKNLT